MSAPKRPIRSTNASAETVPASADAVRAARAHEDEALSGPPGRVSADPGGISTQPADADHPSAERADDDDSDDHASRQPGRPPVREDGTSDRAAGVGAHRSWPDQPVLRLISGAAMPKVGLGTWQLSDREADVAVSAGLDIGVRHIDTAQMYGNEAAVGAAIRASGVDRNDIFLTTKVANDRHAPDDLLASVHESLAALDTDHVDLLLVHWPVDFDRVAATADVMAQVQAAGLASHIGLSNFTLEQLSVVADIAPFEVLQAERHPWFPQPELLDWCRAHGWVFTSYSPLAQGRVLDDETIGGIARRLDVSPAAVAIAWHLGSDGVAVIPRSSSPDHVRANYEAHALELPPEAVAALGDLRTDERLVDPAFAPW